MIPIKFERAQVSRLNEEAKDSILAETKNRASVRFSQGFTVKRAIVLHISEQFV